MTSTQKSWLKIPAPPGGNRKCLVFCMSYTWTYSSSSTERNHVTCFHHHSNQMLRFDFEADFDWQCNSIIIPLGLGQQNKSDWTPSTGDLWLTVKSNVSYCTLTLCEVSHVSLSWTLDLSSLLTSTIQAHNSSLKWCWCKIWSCCC